jgi:hypothetical protein
MSFDDINREINDRRKAMGGEWKKLNRVEHGRVSGKVVHVQARDKVYEGQTILITKGPNEGKPRKEWVFTLENAAGDKVKYAANENAQYAILQALDGRQIEEGAMIEVWVTEDPKKKTEQATYKASYGPPMGNDPFEGSDETPF